MCQSISSGITREMKQKFKDFYGFSKSNYFYALANSRNKSVVITFYLESITKIKIITAKVVKYIQVFSKSVLKIQQLF